MKPKARPIANNIIYNRESPINASNVEGSLLKKPTVFPLLSSSQSFVKNPIHSKMNDITNATHTMIIVHGFNGFNLKA